MENPDKEDLTLWPWPPSSPQAMRLLQEYFTLPHRGFFFDIDVHNAFDPDAFGDAFELQLVFNNPPELPDRLAEDSMRLFCTPVVNLFSCDANPIRREPLRDGHLLRAGGMDFQHAEVYSVDEVVGVRHRAQGRTTYKAFGSFAPHATDPSQASYFYTVSRQHSPID